MRCLVFAFLLAASSCTPTLAPAVGWNSTDPAVQAWFNEAPVKKCCSLSDGFEADEFDSTQGGVWATITDDGENAPCWDAYDEETDFTTRVCRRPVPETRRYYVPSDKILHAPPNPTRHGVLFLDNRDQVLCYFLPAQV